MAKPVANPLWRFLGFNTQGDIGPVTFYTSARKKLVFFQKAPPLAPASREQLHHRNLFRLAATSWRLLTAAQRNAWESASKRAKTMLNGYALYLHFFTLGDKPGLDTIRRQAGVNLEM